MRVSNKWHGHRARDTVFFHSFSLFCVSVYIFTCIAFNFTERNRRDEISNNSSSTWAVPLPALPVRELAVLMTVDPSITVPNTHKCLLGRCPKTVIFAHQ